MSDAHDTAIRTCGAAKIPTQPAQSRLVFIPFPFRIVLGRLKDNFFGLAVHQVPWLFPFGEVIRRDSQPAVTGPQGLVCVPIPMRYTLVEGSLELAPMITLDHPIVSLAWAAPLPHIVVAVCPMTNFHCKTATTVAIMARSVCYHEHGLLLSLLLKALERISQQGSCARLQEVHQ